MTRRFNCPSCSNEIGIDAETCPNCGALIDDDATRRFETRKTPVRSSDSIDNARFVPGTILNERYRIVGLPGKCGMGEVYRADDLKLGQPVALCVLLAVYAAYNSVGAGKAFPGKLQ
jgi:hypothetical protein